MAWTVSAKWYNHDRTDYHWKILAMCFDVESLGVVERALQSCGQETRTTDLSTTEPKYPNRPAL